MNKKNYLSSVIVSLLAGFIYYQFGTEIQKSVDDVFSYQELKINVPENSEDLLANFTSPQSNKGIKDINNFFRKVKKKINPENALTENGVAVTGKLKQAKFQKPEPDRNIDFTAELNKLTRKKENSVLLNGSKSLRKNKMETADLDSKQYRQKSIINKECFSATIYKDYVDGNGFEYNYVYQIDNKTGKTIKSKIRSGTSSVNNINTVNSASVIEGESVNEDVIIMTDEECQNSSKCSEKYSVSGNETGKKWNAKVKIIQKDFKNKIKNINKNYNLNYNKNYDPDFNKNSSEDEEEFENTDECNSDDDEIYMEIQSCDDESL